VLACAEDGWVEDWPDGPPKRWNFRGTHRYQACKIHCLTPNGDVMVARPVIPELSLFARFAWRVFNRIRAIEVEFASVPGVAKPLEFFKGELFRALERGGDVMTQFGEKDELAAAIRQSISYADLRELYFANHWT